MPANKIVQIKTVQGGSPENPLVAILTNLDIGDGATADAFLREVAEVFLAHRMCSPAETNAMLITVIGDLTAARCAELWRQFMAEDQALQFFMSQMHTADIVRGTPSGVELEKVSILQSHAFPQTMKSVLNQSQEGAPDLDSMTNQPAGVTAWLKKLFGSG
jgi:hypothetical protein